MKEAALLLIVPLVISCGGGGGGNTASGSAFQTSAGSGSGTSGAPGSPSSSGNVGSISSGQLTAQVTNAPAEGATVSGMLTLEVQGTALARVELLPANGYVPRLGIFTVSPDRSYARLDFDTRSVPNGLLTLRISAFDGPEGSADATEVIAMSARTWSFSNEPAPFGSPAGRAARCYQMGQPYTGLDESQPVVCIRWQVPSPPIPPEQCRGGFDTPYGNPQDGLPVLRDGRRISKLYCEPGANEGRVNPGCECRS